MALSAGEVAFATDLFAGLGALTTRKMMGGLCLYHEGVIFAIVHPEGGIMIKGKGRFVEELEALGCTRWTYQRPGQKATAMPYWSLPPECEDDPDAACSLAREALRHL